MSLGEDVCHVHSQKVAMTHESEVNLEDNCSMHVNSLAEQHSDVAVPTALTEERSFTPASETELISKCQLVDANFIRKTITDRLIVIGSRTPEPVELMDIPPDGNCLFWSFLALLTVIFRGNLISV